MWKPPFGCFLQLWLVLLSYSATNWNLYSRKPDRTQLFTYQRIGHEVSKLGLRLIPFHGNLGIRLESTTTKRHNNQASQQPGVTGGYSRCKRLCHTFPPVPVHAQLSTLPLETSWHCFSLAYWNGVKAGAGNPTQKIPPLPWGFPPKPLPRNPWPAPATGLQRVCKSPVMIPCLVMAHVKCGGHVVAER